MVGEVRLKGANRLEQFPVFEAAVFNVQRVGQFVEDLQGPIDLAVPQVPFEVLQHVLQVGAQRRLILPLHALGQPIHPGDPHREVELCRAGAPSKGAGPSGVRAPRRRHPTGT